MIAGARRIIQSDLGQRTSGGGLQTSDLKEAARGVGKSVMAGNAENGRRDRGEAQIAKNRHRGSGRPLSPATPPYMRVRIRRFRKIEPVRAGGSIRRSPRGLRRSPGC